MSQSMHHDVQPLIARERKLSDAAATHLLSKGGAAGLLATAMNSDVKRIRASLNARAVHAQPDVLVLGQDGSLRIIEAKEGRYRRSNRRGWVSALASILRYRRGHNKAA